MSAPRTARAIARAELTAAILDAARRQLAAEGAAALSLRAVARELGMASSAVYRYFPSRDDLLTALIIETYDAIGEAAEKAEARAQRDRGGPGARWLAAARGVRRWAKRHPHEFALVYGSPVPGYAAPADTVTPATRTARVLARILRDADAAGALGELRDPLPRSLAGPGLREVGGGELSDADTDLPERALVLLTGLVGLLTAELFGHLEQTVTDRDAWFDAAVSWTAAIAGLELRLGEG